MRELKVATKECPVCDGAGKHNYPYGHLTDPCGTCEGSGRLPLGCTKPPLVLELSRHEEKVSLAAVSSCPICGSPIYAKPLLKEPNTFPKVVFSCSCRMNL